MTRVLKRKNHSFQPASVLFDYVKVNRFEANKDDWIDIVIENINMVEIIPDKMIIDMYEKLFEVKEITWD
jgi:hypothetical protein